MAKPKNKKTQEEQQRTQPFDTTFKDWIRQQARAILPLLLVGAIYEDTLDVEIIRPTMRVDKVFKIIFMGKVYIFHIEFESGTDPHMVSRLLIYNAILYHDYQLPVISMIVYPFKTKIAESPLQVSRENGNIITFDFLTLPLFTLDAEQYVREHLVCMYPLLPTMQGTNHVMMQQAMDELAELYREDEVTLAQQFVWMNLLLERTETIAPPEKVAIKEALKMYDRLWSESPTIKKIRTESETQGEVRAAQRMLVNFVKLRFPALTELAQQRISQINKPDALDLLAQQIYTAPDEHMVRWLLSTPVA